MTTARFDPFAIDGDPLDLEAADPFELDDGDQSGVRMGDLYPQRTGPFSWIAIGPYGCGKTAFTVAMARIELEAMARHGRKWKVWSNIEVGFAERSDPNIIYVVEEYTPDVRDLSLIVDEAPAMLPSARWNARENQRFRRFNEQIRKRNIHLYGTAISALEVDGGYVRMIDLFIRCKAYGRRIALFVHDHYGKMTGSTFRKVWPPQAGDEDYRRWFHPHPWIVEGMYDTHEIVAPMQAADREGMLARDPRYDRLPDAELEGLVDRQAAADAERSREGRLLLKNLESVGEFKVSDYFHDAGALFDGIRAPKDWQGLLERNGFELFRPGEFKPWMARFAGGGTGYENGAGSWDAGP